MVNYRCSSGFGRELARQLLELGYRTVVTARNPAQITAAVEAAEAHFGRIDVLVNPAGIGYFAAVEEGEDDAVRQLFEINVFGLTHMIQAILPGMRKRCSGFVVNLSSLRGLRSPPGLATRTPANLQWRGCRRR